MIGKLTPMQVVLKNRAALETQVQEQAREIERLKEQIEGLKRARDDFSRMCADRLDRACDAESERDALRAELERLKPSGPVAEDERVVQKFLSTSTNWHDDTPPYPEARAALSRLASQAQAAQAKDEAIEALAEELRGALKDIRGRAGHRLLTPNGEWCICENCTRRLAALRLAGRLP